MDARLRKLERLARQGDPSARAALARHRERLAPIRIMWYAEPHYVEGKRHVFVEDGNDWIPRFYTPALRARSLTPFIEAWNETASYYGPVRCRAVLVDRNGNEVSSRWFWSGPPEREEFDRLRLE